MNIKLPDPALAHRGTLENYLPIILAVLWTAIDVYCAFHHSGTGHWN